MNEQDKIAICCPHCKSTQVVTDAKGFSVEKAAVGAVLLGPIGLLGGAMGNKKIKFTCLQCGYSWNLEQQIRHNQKQQKFERATKGMNELQKMQYEQAQIAKASAWTPGCTVALIVFLICVFLWVYAIFFY